MAQPIKPKKFTDVVVTHPYVTYQKLNHNIRYKTFNKSIEIDLKDIIDTVLKDAGITGFDTEQFKLTIPYNIDDTTSGDSITILLDKKRFHIRLPEMMAHITKQQKIGFDNTHPHRWNKAEWIKFIEARYFDTYGFKSLELNLRGHEGSIRRGKLFGYIDKLIKKIKSIDAFEADENSVVEYIVWVFSNKNKMSLSLPLICCDSFIQEWVVWKKKKLKEGVNAPNAKVSKKWIKD